MPSEESNIQSSIKRIEKKFGKGAVIKLGDSQTVDVDVIPTGIWSIDNITGIGGMPRGRIVEFFGPESSGKTMLSLYVIREAQKMGLDVAFIDAEQAFNIELAKRIGVDVDSLYISQPDGGEEALEIVNIFSEDGSAGLIVVDSVAALVPRAEVDGDIGDAHVGLQARLMSQTLRKITAPAKRNNICVIFINQLRMKVNMTGYGGNPETTPGGRALPFYASMRIDVRSVGTIKDGEDVIGRRTRIKVIKNKLSAPFRRADVDLRFGANDQVGFDIIGDIVDVGVKCGIIDKKGSWYSLDGESLGQGREGAKAALAEKKDELVKMIDMCMGKNTDEEESHT